MRRPSPRARALVNSLLLLTAVLAPSFLVSAPRAAGPLEQVAATGEFEYSYSTETKKEIVESWLDVSYQLGDFRTGILYNARQPAEELNNRGNGIRHRFFEFARSGVSVRAGHFYGLFGRGLLFAAREDRRIRIDTVLDGVLVSAQRGRFRGSAFTGTPTVIDRGTLTDSNFDLRGFDGEVGLGQGLTLGATGLTNRADRLEQQRVNRDWAAAPRLTYLFSFGDCYLESGWREDLGGYNARRGRAHYGSLNLYRGSFSLSAEYKDYRHFSILPDSTAVTPLNNPPSLTREHLYTLLNRAPHNLNADDEKGAQVELTVAGPGSTSLLLNASRTRQHNGLLVFEEIYGQLERDAGGPLFLRGGFGYRESEGLRQVIVGEALWRASAIHSLSVTAEHQHVRLGGDAERALGAFDEEFIKLEYNRAPSWTVSGILELNNKYVEQRSSTFEKSGPFPAMQVTYASLDGARLSLWAGKRQAGYLCAGGVCKFEPAFEGVELTGTIRY